MKIGILRETTRYYDQRVVLSPEQCKIVEKTENIKCFIQPSLTRIFKNDDYEKAGICLSEDLSECDLLIGVKEVDISTVIPNKNYLFFAHVAKKQPYHKIYLKKLIRKNISLTDFEYFKNEEGKRLIGFGYWAGIVGAYNAIEGIGKKNGLFDIPPAHVLQNYQQLLNIVKAIKLPNLRFLITGTGNSAKGAIELLYEAGVCKISVNDYLNNTKHNYPIVCQLKPEDYVVHKKGYSYSKSTYYKSPSQFDSTFEKYTKNTDIYIPCHYYQPGSPNLITNHMLSNKECRIQLIADVSCDIMGPIASTIRESTHEKPFYGYYPKKEKEVPPFQDDAITVMAVDNLPAALPAEASLSFGNLFIKHIIPLFSRSNKTWNNATIIKNGEITSHFFDLQDFILDKKT